MPKIIQFILLFLGSAVCALSIGISIGNRKDHSWLMILGAALILIGAYIL